MTEDKKARMESAQWSAKKLREHAAELREKFYQCQSAWPIMEIVPEVPLRQNHVGRPTVRSGV